MAGRSAVEDAFFYIVDCNDSIFDCFTMDGWDYSNSNKLVYCIIFYRPPPITCFSPLPTLTASLPSSFPFLLPLLAPKRADDNTSVIGADDAIHHVAGRLPGTVLHYNELVAQILT